MNKKFIFALKKYQPALFAALFFGMITPGSKLFVAHVPPQSMAGLLYLFAGLGLLLILLWKKNLAIKWKQIKLNDYQGLFFATLFGGVLGPLFLTFGLTRMSGNTSSLLLNFEAVCTSLIAWFIFKEHFERKIVYGMILIVLGCFILSYNTSLEKSSDTPFGFLLICFACLSWAIDNNVTRKISHLDSILIASLKGVIAGSTNLLIGLISGDKIIWNSDILGIAFLGFFGIGISLVSFIHSLRTIGTSRTGALFSTAPFIGSFFSIILLHEEMTISFVLALLLMAIGVWFHLSEDHEHEHLHEEFEHNHAHSHDDDHHDHHHDDHDHSSHHHHHHVHRRVFHKHSHFPDIHHLHHHIGKE